MENDFIGRVFGRLTVVSLISVEKKDSFYMCKCKCGNEKIIRRGALKSGSTVSCGCYRNECVSKRFSTHGLSRDKNGKQTRLHRMWSDMKARCSIKTHQSFHNYGGRGITLCDEWFNDYLSFHKWALKNGYKKNLTIERIDNDGNYCPENCTFITKSDNSGHRRNVVLNEKDVLKIKKLLSRNYNRGEIASKFNVSLSHVHNIASGHRWGHIKI